MAMLAKVHGDGTLDKQLTILSRPKLLIIDELGYLPFEARCRAPVLPAGLVALRTGIDSDHRQPLGREWGGVFGDPAVATAILDCLLHHSTVTAIRGSNSARLRLRMIYVLYPIFAGRALLAEQQLIISHFPILAQRVPAVLLDLLDLINSRPGYWVTSGGCCTKLSYQL